MRRYARQLGDFCLVNRLISVILKYGGCCLKYESYSVYFFRVRDLIDHTHTTNQSSLICMLITEVIS